MEGDQECGRSAQAGLAPWRLRAFAIRKSLETRRPSGRLLRPLADGGDLVAVVIANPGTIKICVKRA